MNDCCSSVGCAPRHPAKAICPGNGRECAEVPARTIVHHLKTPWAWQARATRYYFCADPGCDIVYFGDDGTTIGRSGLRTRVGQKEQADDALLCYCFGVRWADFRAAPAIRDFVVAQTRAGACSCETHNPSGRCCLKDFPKG